MGLPDFGAPGLHNLRPGHRLMFHSQLPGPTGSADIVLSYPQDLFHPPGILRRGKLQNSHFFLRWAMNPTNFLLRKKHKYLTNILKGNPTCATSLRGRGCKPCRLKLVGSPTTKKDGVYNILFMVSHITSLWKTYGFWSKWFVQPEFTIPVLKWNRPFFQDLCC